MIGSHFALRSSSSTGGEVDPVWYELIIGMIVYFLLVPLMDHVDGG